MDIIEYIKKIKTLYYIKINISDYQILLACVTIICFAIFYYGYYIIFLQNIKYDFNSARYLLSTIVQAEVTILSLIITVTLIVAQIVSSPYSLKINSIFLRTRFIWITISFYVVTIIYELALLNMVRDTPLTNSVPEPLTTSLQYQIFIGFILSVTAIYILIPYTYKFLKLTDIDRIFYMLFREKSVKKAMDVFSPIMQNAVEKNEYGTWLSGWNKLTDWVENIFEEDLKHPDNEPNSYGGFILHPHMSSLIFKIVELKRHAERLSRPNFVFYIIFSMGLIGSAAARKKHHLASDLILSYLKNFLDEYIKLSKQNDAENVMEAIGQIGEAAADNQTPEFENVLQKVISSIDYGIKNFPKGNFIILARYLGGIGRRVAKQKSNSVIVEKIVSSLKSYQTLIENPDKSLFFYECEKSLACISYYNKRYESAIEFSTITIEFKTKHADQYFSNNWYSEAWYIKGRSYMALDMYSEAKKALGKARELKYSADDLLLIY